MFVVHLFVLVVAALCCGRTTSACYEHCSATFTHRIQLLQGLTDSNDLTQRSCQAMAEHMVCLEERRDDCDALSVQHINSIINFMKPDYERTCATVVSTSPDSTATPASLLETQCLRKVGGCIVLFNSTFPAAISGSSPDWITACDLLDNYTLCVEDLMPECGRHLSDYITTIRLMQQRFSANCSASSNPLAQTECVNDTLDCYDHFNTTFSPAASQYHLDDMCNAMDMYTLCLHGVHERKECERYTQHALSSLFAFKSRYAIYCGTDGGQHAQVCVTEFQRCYKMFNITYFPALHMGNMNGICSSVVQYSRCVQPLYEDCGLQMHNALTSVRVLKEQFALQCDPEYQRLSRCHPLAACLTQFSEGLAQMDEVSASGSTSSAALCTRLEAYFPCVESSLADCNIPPEDTSVDFSQLGSLLGAYCKHLLGNSVLDSCEEFKTCASGIVLVSVPDPSAMFDADTWCSYMDMSLSCVQRAVNTPSCGLGQDDTIKGHLSQQRQLKRDVCKLASVAPIPTEPTNLVNPDDGHGAGHGGSDAMRTRAGVASLVSLTVVALVFQLLF